MKNIEFSLAQRLARLPQIKKSFSRNPGESVPLSYGQKRIWTIEQITPGTPTYNMPVAYRLEGDLDVSALKLAFTELVRRHEALRTCFRIPGGASEPVQFIHPTPEFGWVFTDLSSQPATEAEVTVAALGKAEVRRPFDLSEGPLVRVTLYRLRPALFIMVINCHHIISDGWSHGIVVRELNALYRAFSEEKSSPLAAQNAQYADFTLWQQGARDEKALKSQLSYWREKLASPLPVLELPSDKPRPAIKTQQGDVLHFTIDAPTTQAIKALSREAGASPFMTFLSAVDVLFYRLSGQTDIVIGTPIAGRNEPGHENIVGYFANTLALRSSLDGDPTFRELVLRNRVMAMEAYANQDVPFERLVEELRLERSMSYTPVFQVMFTFQNQPLPPFDFPGMKIGWNLFHSQTSKFDLWVSLEERDGGFAGHFEYSTDLFERATIARFIDCFDALLRGICKTPNQRISALPLQSEEAARSLTEGFNQTARDYGALQTLSACFESQVERSPEAVCLSFEGRSLTYSELNNRANQLAHRLIKEGVGPGALVGVAIERSFELLIALYAITKSGGAYVPLDPAYPKDRLGFMIQDCGASILLTQESVVEKLPKSTARMMVVDTEWVAIATESTSNPAPRAGLDDLAYMIYTSGSTGNPKGAMVHHEAIANRLRWQQEYFGLTSSDVVLQKTPYSFDVSVWELFWPLQIGARLLIARPEGHKDPVYLTDIIRGEGVTTLHFVPTMLRVFLEEESAGACTSIKRIICSGEELPKATVMLSHETLPEAEVTNLYGPTECAVDVSVYTPRRGNLPSFSIPIGVPIANTQLYILDEHLTPCPIGVSGELFIAGVQVGRGYLNREVLTAEKFIPDPYRPGARMYRTGDRARYLPDGNIEFLGRLDHQVKVNGLRIETGEIESVLLQHPGVSQALVTVTGIESKKLVAYIVAKAEAESVGQLEAALTGDQVSHWRKVFNENYSSPGEDDPIVNLVGWTSSYDGLPIPKEDMLQWLDTTVERIQACKPRRILEIGCGTGLFLFRLAPHCEHYTGTEISDQALGDLGRLLSRPELRRLPVELMKRPAEDFSGFEPGSFDLVLLNSVIQYFPTQAYLKRVIDQALEVLADDGVLVIGDVRHFGLLHDFHVRVAPGKSESTLRKRMLDENELLVHPEFFTRVPNGRSEIRLKRGTYVNELSQFRYDVVIHKKQAKPPVPPLVPWTEQLTEVTTRLAEGCAFVLTEVPNQRLLGAGGKAPSDWERLAASHGYRAELCWSAEGLPGSYDVLFTKGDSVWSMPGEVPPERPRPAHELTNNPLLSGLALELTPQLKQHLRAQLPEFMAPSVLCFLPSFPLSPSGKISRSELPGPQDTVENDAESFVAPRTELEAALARVWCEVLNLERIGVCTNFFELGGDSIKTIQVASRATKQGIPMASRQIFENQTIETLALAIDKRPAPIQHDAAPFELSGLSVDERANLEAVYPDIEDAYPLAPFQYHELIELQDRPPTALYAMAAVFPVTDCDPKAFERAWNRVRSRHSSLRTSFHWRNTSVPLQILHRHQDAPLEIVDLSSFSRDEIQRRLDEYLDCFRATPFVLDRLPQHRLTLFKTGKAEFQFFFGFNYMIHDGWSTFHMLDEILVFHSAYARGAEPNRSTPKPFRTYMAWLAAQDHAKAEAFWKDQLAGGLKCAPLAERTPGNAPDASVHFHKECVRYSPEFTARLNRFSRKNKITQSSLVFGAWGLLQAQLTGLDDIVFGTVVSGRPEEIPDVEGIMGHFNNMLPLRVSIRRDERLLPWLQSLQNTHVQMRQYGFVSPVRMRDYAGFRPRESLYQSHVVFENFPVSDKVKAQFEGKDAANSRGAAQLDTPLRLELWPGDELLVIMAYYGRYFNVHGVRALHRRLETLLDRMVTHPDALLSDFFSTEDRT